ncbi:MAG: hypothetical protein AAB855_00540 [Patescibacteria group bacterium]
MKTAGRKAGTPNKRTVAVEKKLTELGCDPIEGMARIAIDKKNPLEMRAKMYAELAPYVVPKRKSMEMTGELVTFVISGLYEESEPGEEEKQEGKKIP